MATINPYLNFSGNCEEAFNFYKACFGAEFQSFNRFNEMPGDSQVPESESEWIMHVSLPIGRDNYLMGSDQPSSMGVVKPGNNVQISIQTVSDSETDRLFNALSAGGKITMPLEQTFWGARYGMFVDKFGIHWMVNQENSQNE